MWQVEVITESEKTGKIKQYEYSCEDMKELKLLMRTFEIMMSCTPNEITASINMKQTREDESYVAGRSDNRK